ncbi:hypothetical protein DFJ65_2142 [Calidifontibacter indicus]|uniref:Asp/Glu/hydantoin racemase n=1 Tax=Calidifontibacter indicus TaxID=419650 RepID=A0A3D9USY8_9MICO|nr:hypothetical protein DFJ65_2142 [Calidifontibacter indicus]
MTGPGFLHTSPVHPATFDRLLARRRPGVQALHVVDEKLLVDARNHGPDAVAERVAQHLTALVGQGATVVCCTCSTIGDTAERARADVPVFRVDRPMAARAVRCGPRVGVVAALESTLEPTAALLRQEAESAGQEVRIEQLIADGAWGRFEDGDEPGYLASVVHTARRLADDVDILILAQASMAGAEPLLADLAIPVLSSPGPAVQHLLGLT